MHQSLLHSFLNTLSPGPSSDTLDWDLQGRVGLDLLSPLTASFIGSLFYHGIPSTQEREGMGWNVQVLHLPKEVERLVFKLLPALTVYPLNPASETPCSDKQVLEA